LLGFQIVKWIEVFSVEVLALVHQRFSGGNFSFSLKAGGHPIALRRGFAKAATRSTIPAP
jgi:hypothetical protein